MPKKDSINKLNTLKRKIIQLEKQLKEDNKKARRRRARTLSSSETASSDSDDSSEQQNSVQGYRGDCTSSTNMPADFADEMSVPGSRAASPLLPLRALPVDSPRGPEASGTGLLDTQLADNAAGDIHSTELDRDILNILGDDPTIKDIYGKDIQKDLAVRLQHSATIGLCKESRRELLNTYLIPGNCKLIGAPILNPELKAALTEPVVKRDKAIELKQKIVSAAISSLSQAISQLITTENRDTNLLKQLMDSGRLMCDCLHSDTQTRRNYVTSSIKKDMKEALQGAKVDKFLFGENLNDTLKTAKAVNKSGTELKENYPKHNTFKKPAPPSSKNWRNNLARKPGPATPLPSKKETSTSTKPRRAGYFRPSQNQRPARNHH